MKNEDIVYERSKMMKNYLKNVKQDGVIIYAKDKESFEVTLKIYDEALGSNNIIAISMPGYTNYDTRNTFREISEKYGVQYCENFFQNIGQNNPLIVFDFTLYLKSKTKKNYLIDSNESFDLSSYNYKIKNNFINVLEGLTSEEIHELYEEIYDNKKTYNL